jgi:hypothetical protein
MMYLAVNINDYQHNVTSVIVNLFTWSKAYHVEPVFSDGYAFRASPKYMGYIKEKYNYYEWLMIPCSFITEVEEAIIRKEFDELADRNPKYDYLGAISGVFGSSRQNPNKWYCGELCVKAFGEHIPALKELSWATPEKVWELVAEYVNEHS